MRMPDPIAQYMEAHAWGQMHLEWHTERRWDRLPGDARAYAEQQGWARAAHQEGDAGNGLEFLAMHREMLHDLVEHDASAAPLLAGWTTPPTDPHAPADPLPAGATTPFDPQMAAALDRLEHHLDSFASDDELGRYIETSFGTTDRTAGIHNYLHNRFQDPSSAIDIGNPAVNLLNQRFWRLHGWIDHVWSAWRAQAHASDTAPDYVAAMQAAHAAMTMKMKGMRAGPPPKSLIDAVRP